MAAERCVSDDFAVFCLFWGRIALNLSTAVEHDTLVIIQLASITTCPDCVSTY